MKKARVKRQKDVEDLRSEINILMQCRHKRIVTYYGCVRPDNAVPYSFIVEPFDSLALILFMYNRCCAY